MYLQVEKPVCAAFFSFSLLIFYVLIYFLNFTRIVHLHFHFHFHLHVHFRLFSVFTFFVLFQILSLLVFIFHIAAFIFRS